MGLKNADQSMSLSLDVFSFLSHMHLTFRLQTVHDLLQRIPLILWDLKEHSEFFQFHRHIKLITDKLIYNFFPFLKNFVHNSSLRDNPDFTLVNTGFLLQRKRHSIHRVSLISINHSLCENF